MPAGSHIATGYKRAPTALQGSRASMRQDKVRGNVFVANLPDGYTDEQPIL